MSEKLIVALSADISDLKKELARANGMLEGWSKKSEQGTSGAAKGFDNLESAVKGAIGAYVSFQAVQQALIASFNTALKLDAISQSFGVIFKSAEEGERQFERLKRKANELGLSILSLADSYKQFSASSNLSVNETNRIFDSVAKSGAVLKLSEDQVSRALTAMAQMMSKGTVQAEELKGQLGEALPGAFQLAAKAMGTTTQGLQKMLENGQVLASDLLPKLANELDKAFGSKVQGDVKGLQSEWNKFKNNFTLLVEASKVGDAFDWVLKHINDDIKQLVQSTKSAGQLLTESLQLQIDETKNVKELNALINRLDAHRDTLREGSDAWKVYTNAIVEAGKKVKDFTPPKIDKKIEVDVNSIDTIKAKIKSIETQMNGVEVGSKAFFKLNEQLQVTRKQLEDIDFLLAKQKIGKAIKFEMPNIDTQLSTADIDLSALAPTQSDINAFAEYNDLLQKASEYGLIFGQGVDLNKTKVAELNTNAQALVSTLGGALTSAFDAALINGQNFGEVLLKAIGDLIKKMLAAVAVASILSAILSSLGIGSVALGGAAGSSLFGTILKGLTGFGGGGSTAGHRVATVGGNIGSQGGIYELKLRGNDLVASLNNTANRNNRTR